MEKEFKKKKEHSTNSLLVFFRHLVLSIQKNCKPKYPPKGLWEWAAVHSGKMQTLKVTEVRRQMAASSSLPPPRPGQQHTGRAGSLKAVEDSQQACWTPWVTVGARRSGESDRKWDENRNKRETRARHRNANDSERNISPPRTRRDLGESILTMEESQLT